MKSGTDPVRHSRQWIISRVVLPAIIGIVCAMLFRWTMSMPGLASGLGGLAIAVGTSLAVSFVLHRENSEYARVLNERNRMFNLSMDMICVAGFDGYLKEVNPAFERLTGWTQDEWQSTPFIEKTHPDDRSRVVEVMKSLSEEKPLLDFESRTLCKDGTYRWFSVNSFPVVRDGVVYAICRDITKRKQDEQTIRQLNEQLQARADMLTLANKGLEERDRLFDLSFDMLCIAGLDGYFKVLNPSWQRVLGWTNDELQAKPSIDFVHPDDRAFTMAARNDLKGGMPALGVENRYLCKNGDYKWLSWNSVSLIKNDLVYAVARDITDRKHDEEVIIQLNEQLQSRADMLDTRNQELEAFSYSVSHDLRTPLRHVVGFVQLLRKNAETSLDATSREYLNIIEKSTRQMGVLIDDLLEFSRMGTTELRWTSVALTELVNEVIRPLMEETGDRKIEWVISDLPNARGDRALLKLALVNLLGNAVKYSRPRPTARIEMGTLSPVSGTPRGFGVVFIKDNGVGFDMQNVGRLFGVFQRLHSAAEFEGTGIGLANAKRIINRHGGRIWAESKPDDGATFFMTLPLWEIT